MYLIKNPKVAKTLAMNARKYVLENLTWEKNVDAVEKIYTRAIK